MAVSRCSEMPGLNNISPEVVDKNVLFVMSCLGIPKDEALLLVSQYIRMAHGIDNLDKFMLTLERIQLDIHDIFNHPQIFRYLPKTIEYRYHRLIELGIDRPSVLSIIGFSKIVDKTSKQLKEEGIIAAEIDPLDVMVQMLDGPPDLKQIINEHYPLLKEDTVNRMRMVLNLEYLSWRLGISLEKVVAIIKKYKPISNHTLCSIVELWNILTSYLSFSPEKVKSNGFLLTLQANDVRKMIQKLPVLGGCTIQTLILKFPKILLMPIDCLQEIDTALRDYGVTADQIEKCANVFTLRPSTLKKRLEELESIPEFKVLQDHPRFLYLLYYQQKAKHRLKLMKQLGFKEFTIDVLCTSEQYFSNFIDSDKNKEFRASFITFLAEQLDCSRTRIRFRLQPYSLSGLSVESVSTTLDYLFKFGFSSQEILSCVPIVLYEVASIQKELTYSSVTNGSTCIDKMCALSKVLLKLKTSDKEKLICKHRLSHMMEPKYGRYIVEDSLPVNSYLGSGTVQNSGERE